MDRAIGTYRLTRLSTHGPRRARNRRTNACGHAKMSNTSAHLRHHMHTLLPLVIHAGSVESLPRPRPAMPHDQLDQGKLMYQEREFCAVGPNTL